MGINESAYLLVYHGSRDPRPKIAVEKLASHISQRISKQLLRNSSNYSQDLVNDPSSKASTTLTEERRSIQAPLLHPKAIVIDYTDFVGTASLELAVKPLHEQIIDFASLIHENGYKNLQIVPLFLLAGVHLKEDIPSEIAIAQEILGNLGNNIKLNVRPYLGSHPGLESLIARKFLNQISNTASAKILVSHGSRRPEASRQVEAIAASIGASIAYFSIPPNLESLVLDFVAKGSKEITIMPYFLFPGSITDTIALTIERLNLQFPAVSFKLIEPLGTSAELATLIWDLVEK
ncbi:MAG: sirohydrochlorin chelatase [Mastigocoleus sp.]